MAWFTYLLLGLALLMVAMQLWGLWLAKRRQGQPAPDFADLVPPELGGAPTLLFYFYGERCGPCRALAPLTDRLAREYPHFIKVDVAKHPDGARRFGVMGTPTFVWVTQGRIERVILGAATEATLTRMLQ